jgi:hypothetical protein
MSRQGGFIWASLSLFNSELSRFNILSSNLSANQLELILLLEKTRQDQPDRW